MSASEYPTQIREAVSDGIARAVAAIGLCGVALIHLLDIHGKFDATPYMFWMYAGLIVACLALAATLVRTSDSRAWRVAGALPASVIVGYTLSRTIGLPQATDDIGNWSEPLGMASLFVEGSLVALTGGVLLARRSAGRDAHRGSGRATADLVAA